MPKGYAIFTETIRDQAGYDAYVEKAIPTIAESGGRVIVVHDDPEVLEGAIRRARVFAGHAGWGPGQLEGELEEEAWIVEPPLREEIFSGDASGLWAAILRRKGRRYALLSTMPLDPSLN